MDRASSGGRPRSIGVAPWRPPERPRRRRNVAASLGQSVASPAVNGALSPRPSAQRMRPNFPKLPRHRTTTAPAVRPNSDSKRFACAYQEIVLNQSRYRRLLIDLRGRRQFRQASLKHEQLAKISIFYYSCEGIEEGGR